MDTAEDLVFARAVAAHVGHPPPARLAELEAVIAAEPELAGLNRAVRQEGRKEMES